MSNRKQRLRRQHEAQPKEVEEPREFNGIKITREQALAILDKDKQVMVFRKDKFSKMQELRKWDFEEWYKFAIINLVSKQIIKIIE